MTHCDAAPARAPARCPSWIPVGASLLAAGFTAGAGPAAAQTAQPEVEVNLEALEALVPTPPPPGLDPPDGAPPALHGQTSRVPGAVSGESVLLLPGYADTTVGSAPPLDAPATAGGEDFALPPPEPADGTETAVTVLGTEKETAVATAEAADATVVDNDAFHEIGALFARTAAPEEIDVPEPAMTMAGTGAAGAPADDASASAGPGDLRLLFEGGGDNLSVAARDMLIGLAARLEARRDRRVELRAYASGEDASPSEARRLALSRALAVRSFLVENNVRSTRIDVKTLGDRSEGGPPDRVDIVLMDR